MLRLIFVVALLGGCDITHRCRVTTDCLAGKVCDDGQCAANPTYCTSFDPQVGDCVLTSLSPRLAEVGATLTVEGEFPETVAVAFQDIPARVMAVDLGPVPDYPPAVEIPAVSVPYSRPSKHRLEVVVPDLTTTLGKDPAWTGMTSLQVTDGNGRQVSETFRFMTFPPAIRGMAFRPQPVGVRQTSKLKAQRSGHCMMVSGHVVFAVGGEDMTTHQPLDDVERALTSVDGSLNVFITEQRIDNNLSPNRVALSTPRAYAACVEVDDVLYLIGGTGPNGVLASIDRVIFTNEGSIYVPITPPPTEHLLHARAGAMAAIVGNMLYVMGGTDENGQQLDTIERAQIFTSTQIGDFSDRNDAGDPLPRLVRGRSDAQARLIDDELVVMGGRSGSTTLSSIEAAKVHDSALQPFRELAPLLFPRERASSVVLGNKLYLMGGLDNGQPLASIELAMLDGSLDNVAINPSGSVFSEITPGLMVAGAGAGVAQWGNYVHLVGGTFQETQTVAFDAGAVLPKFYTDVGLPQIGRDANAFTNVGRYMWALGGNEVEVVNNRTVGVADVQYAKLNTGELSYFNKLPSGLVYPRTDATSAVVGSWLYVIGGASNGLFAPAIERAAINPGGTLGPFQVVVDSNGVPATTVYPRHRPASVIVKDNLYILGGVESGGGSHVIERAQIVPGADGAPSLGPFVAEDSSNLATSRENPSVIAIGDSIYVLGGAKPDASSTYGVVSLSGGERMRFDPATGRLLSDCGKIACHTFEPTMNVARENAGLLVVDDKLLLIGGFWYPAHPLESQKAPYSSIEVAQISATGLSNFQVYSVNESQVTLGDQRNSPSMIIVNNRAYAFGGMRGSSLCLDSDWGQLGVGKVPRR